MAGMLASLGRALWIGATSARISLSAAGCAFYAMLALFPSLTLLVSLYGAMLDPASVEPQLALLARFLPPDAYAIIAIRLRELASAGPAPLHLQTVISIGIATWSGSAGIRAMLSALTLARAEKESRNFLAFYATAFAMTAVAVLGSIVAIAGLVALSPLLALLGLTEAEVLAIRGGAVVPVLLLIWLATAALYRYGPGGPRARWRSVLPGAALSTLLWAAASVLFSVYVGRWGEYDRVYGSLGAAMALLMWFYVATHAVLLGMEWNEVRAREKRAGSAAGAGSGTGSGAMTPPAAPGR